MPTSGSRTSSTARSFAPRDPSTGSAALTGTTSGALLPPASQVRPPRDEDRGSPPPRRRRQATRNRGGRGGLPRGAAPRPREPSGPCGDLVELELRLELEHVPERIDRRRRLVLRLVVGRSFGEQRLADTDQCLLSRAASPRWGSRS